MDVVHQGLHRAGRLVSSIVAIVIVWGAFAGLIGHASARGSGTVIYNVHLNGGGTSIQVPGGTPVGVDFDYRIWSDDAGPNWIWQIVVGLDATAQYCAYDNIPGVYPGVTGTSSNSVTAPLTPGVYYLYWADDLQFVCGDALNNYANLTKFQIGAIIVGGAGGTVVSGVNLGNQGPTPLTVDRGGSFLAYFDYQIWSDDAGPNWIWQIVVGLDATPLFCAYDNIPGVYAGVTGYSFTSISAPLTPGQYTLYWANDLQFTCADAINNFAALAKHAFGTVYVSAGGGARVFSADLNGLGTAITVPTNASINATLSYQAWGADANPSERTQIVLGLETSTTSTGIACAYDDVPGNYPGVSNTSSTTFVGPSTPGTYLLYWGFDTRADCSAALPGYGGLLRRYLATIDVMYRPGGTTITNVSLNGGGPVADVLPNSSVSVRFDYQTWTADNFPTATKQVVVGIGPTALYCAFDGVPGVQPGVSGTSTNTVTAPSTPGIYALDWAEDSQATCADAMANWTKLTKTSFGGFIAHTPPGTIISNVSLNGGGATATVRPKYPVSIFFDYQTWSDDLFPAWTWQIVVAFDVTSEYCAYDDVPGGYPGAIGNSTGATTAPGIEGTYYLYWASDAAGTCDDAMSDYDDGALTPYLLGTIVVRVPVYGTTVDSSPSGRDVIVDGVTITTPQTFSWTEGSSHTLNVSSPQLAGGTRYTFASWSDAGAQDHSVVATANATYTATFTTEHQITVTTSPPGLQVDVDGTPYTAPYAMWCSQGSTHTVSTPTPQAAGGASRYTFTSWSDGGARTHTITCNAPAILTGTFATEHQHTIATNPAGRSFLVDTVSYATPQTFWWASGSSHTIDTPSPQPVGVSTRYVFTAWSDGGAMNHAIAPTAPGDYTATFATEYRASFGTSPPNQQVAVDGNVLITPALVWWTAGSTHALDVPSPQAGAAGTRYFFVSWSDGGGAAHSVTATAPATYTATLRAQYQATVATSPAGLWVQVDAAWAQAPVSYWWDAGSTHTLTVNATQGALTFSSWSDAGARSHIVTANAAATYTASYAAGPGPLTLTASANPQAGVAPLTVAFTATVSGGNPPYSFAWDFGDGSARSTVQNPPAHVYATPRTYTAHLWVNDSAAGSVTDAFTITVLATPPVLDHCTVTPGSASLTVGGTQSFAAHGWTSGNVEISGLTATWTATGGVGTVTAAGVLTASATAATGGVLASMTFNGATVQCSATVDVAAAPITPTVAVTTPTAGAAIQADSVVVSGTATDADRVLVRLDSGDWQTATGVATWSITFAGLSEGQHTIDVRALSGSVASTTLSRTITVSHPPASGVAQSPITLILLGVVAAVAVLLAILLLRQKRRGKEQVAAARAGRVHDAQERATKEPDEGSLDDLDRLEEDL